LVRVLTFESPLQLSHLLFNLLRGSLARHSPLEAAQSTPCCLNSIHMYKREVPINILNLVNHYTMLVPIVVQLSIPSPVIGTDPSSIPTYVPEYVTFECISTPVLEDIQYHSRAASLNHP
jgi:hypothetical protein